MNRKSAPAPEQVGASAGLIPSVCQMNTSIHNRRCIASRTAVYPEFIQVSSKLLQPVESHAEQFSSIRKGSDALESIEFIPRAGACIATRNVIEEKGVVRWMVRGESHHPADNGWQIMSHIDTSDYLNDPSNWQVVSFNDLCSIEPALIGIWDMPVGSDLQIVRDELGIRIVDTPTGREIPRENFYIPPAWRAQ